MVTDATPPGEAANDAQRLGPRPDRGAAADAHDKDFIRRRRARSWALLAVLLALAALFYAITLVKLAKGG